MEEWSDWVVEDDDPGQMIGRMRHVLADRKRSQRDKLEALSLLTNFADDESVAVLRWYQEHPDPGMEIPSLLALMEADRLNRPPQFEPWQDALLEQLHDLGSEILAESAPMGKEAFCAALTERLRAANWAVETGGRGLLKFDGQLINLVPLDMVVNYNTLVDVWDRDAEEAAWEGFEASTAEDEEGDEEVFDPLDHFYAKLRTANLRWGIQLDISGDTLFTDMVENMDVGRGVPDVEYIFAPGPKAWN